MVRIFLFFLFFGVNIDTEDGNRKKQCEIRIFFKYVNKLPLYSKFGFLAVLYLTNFQFEIFLVIDMTCRWNF